MKILAQIRNRIREHWTVRIAFEWEAKVPSSTLHTPTLVPILLE
jgi:hypothetical protein